MYVPLTRQRPTRCAHTFTHIIDLVFHHAQPKFDESDLHRREQQSASTSAVPTASSVRDISSVSFAEPPEDTKPTLATTAPMRSAISKPSPLRNAILGERAHKSMDEDRRRPASDVLTRTLTTVERPAQSKYQTSSGNRAAPPDMARAVHADRALPPRVQSPPRGPSSEQKAASISLHRRLDTNVASPPPLKVLDSDPDMYFNDEDNDAFLAIEDSVMQGAEPAGIVDNVQDRAYDANRNATRNESSRGTGGTRLQVATTMVKSFKRPDTLVTCSTDKDGRQQPTVIGFLRFPRISPCRTFAER